MLEPMATPPPPLFNSSASANCTVYPVAIPEYVIISITSVCYLAFAIWAIVILFYSDWLKTPRKRALRIAILILCIIAMACTLSIGSTTACSLTALIPRPCAVQCLQRFYGPQFVHCFFCTQ